jgi:hypothetical protein
MASFTSSLRRGALLGVLSAAILLLGAAAASAATFTVNTTADNAPNSSECSGAPGDCGLRQAIDKANNTAGDDTVILPAGHYTLTIAGTDEDSDQTGDLDILDNGALTLTGAGARTTTIDANQIDRVLHVVGGATANMSGVTITGGAASSGQGGGIDNQGNLTLTDSTVAGNATTSADEGGGIGNPGTGQLTLTRDTISDNTAGEHGGGVDIDSGTATITDTTITGNTTNDGDGGGVDIDTDATVQFTNDTIASNMAANAGGGVWIEGSNVQFANTIVANNTAVSSGGDCFQSEPPTDQGHNLDTDGSCFTAGSNGDITANPNLGPLQNNGGQTDTMALLDGSPAINAADNSLCPAVDQRGVARPQPAGGVCDIGAYEATPPNAVTQAASGVTVSSATLHGTVNPTNLATTYHFEYGTTTAYGHSSPSQSAGSDFGDHAEFFNVTGLAPNTTYHFRIVAANAVGTSDGVDMTFTTPGAPTVVTGGASSVGATSATIHGSVNPNGVATTYHFQYGTSKSYGKTTTSHSAGSGHSAVSVRARLGGLHPGAIYHYRIVATSAAGTSRGADRTFRTKAQIAVAGLVSGVCMRASSAKVTVRVRSLLGPHVTLRLDGHRVARGTHRTMRLRIALSKLHTGTHHLTVSVHSAAGTTTHTVSFHICARRRTAPSFTG